MDRFIDLTSLLIKHKSTLSHKVETFFHALQATGVIREKKIKLIRGIWYETLVDYKKKRDASASEIILTCTQCILEDWKNVKDPAALQLAALIRESLKRACDIEEDLTHFKGLGDCVLQYFRLSTNNDVQVTDWFLYGIDQFCRKEYNCSCSSASKCDLLETFCLELNGLKVQSIFQKTNGDCNISDLATAAVKHLNRSSFTRKHLKKVLEACETFVSENGESDPGRHNISDLMKSVIFLEGHLSLESKDITTHADKLLASLNSLSTRKTVFKNGSMKKTCSVMFNLFMLTLAKYSERLNDCVVITFECVELFLSIVGKLNDRILARIAYFFNKIVTTENMETILTRLTALLAENAGEFDLEHLAEENLSMKFFQGVIRICFVAVNYKNCTSIHLAVLKILQKTMSLLHDQEYTDGSKLTALLIDIGVIQVKVSRKLEDNFSAMDAAELVIAAAPFDGVKSLVTQWCKAKLSASSDQKNEKSEDLKKRTLSRNLNGKVPERFLAEILIMEMNFYETLRGAMQERLAVLSDILNLTVEEVEKIRPQLTCKQILLRFKSGDTDLNFDAAYALCKPESANWEYFSQIKLVQFLKKWNNILSGVKSESSGNIDLTEIFEIVNSWEYAVRESKSLNQIEESCKLAHDTAAVLGMFGKHLSKLKIMAALWTALVKHCDIDSVTCFDAAMRLRMITSSLIESATSYLALKQLSQAEKYVKMASKAFNNYNSHLKKAESCDTELELRKVLFFHLQTTLADVYLAQGKDNKAAEILDVCSGDTFIGMNNLRHSTAAVFCSVQVLNTKNRSNSGEGGPRAMKLHATLKRIASLKAAILPCFHAVQQSQSKSQSFGVRIDGVCFDVRMQLQVISLFLENLYDQAETYIFMSDPPMASAYIKMGLINAKYLHLRSWYTRFCLLKLKLTSYLQDEDVFKQLCKDFCELIKCDCKSVKGAILENSFLQVSDDEEEDENFKVPDEDAESELFGSEDDDAILVPTKALDMDCYPSNHDDLSVSPAMSRGKRRQHAPLPPILQKSKSCTCGHDNDLDVIATQLYYCCTFSDHCTRANMPGEGLDMCSKAMKIIPDLKDRTVIPEFEDVSIDDFISCLRAETEITSAWLYFMKNDAGSALVACESAQNILENFSFVSNSIFVLRSKIHFLLSRSLQQEPRFEEMAAVEHGHLNALIDGLAKTHISEPVPDLHTPVTRRSQRRTTSSKNAKSNDKSTAKTVRMRKAMSKTTKSKEFKIFTDRPGNTLPVPSLSEDRSPSPNAKSVYDFDSAEDSKTTPQRRLLKETQNIMHARKAATKRHRNKLGMIHTDESKERVRGRVGKTNKSRSRRPDSEQNITDNLHPGREITKCSIAEQIRHLEQSLSSADKVSDFLLIKFASQAFCQCYYKKFAESKNLEDLKQASTFHLFSIGVGTRSVMQVYTKTMEALPCTQKGCGDACRCESKSNDFSPQNAVENVLKDGASYITEATNLLPEKWSVCAISHCQLSGHSGLMITRMRDGELPLHIQIRGDVLKNTLTKFNELMERNEAKLNLRDRSDWWTQRRNMAAELKSIVGSFAKNALGHYLGILQGIPMDENTAGSLSKYIKEIGVKYAVSAQNFPLIEVLLNSWHCLTMKQKLRGVLGICGHDVSKEQSVSIGKDLECASTKLKLENEERGHVILILDKDVQLLPWEHIPQLQSCSVTRMPSLDVLKTQLGLLKTAEKNIAKEGVNFEDVSYVLNPSGDLKNSEKRFDGWFKSAKSWKGIVSRAPLQNEWISSITDFDLFIYCGHGSGQKYVSRKDFSNIRTRAAALLMGCSSAKLDQNGVFEPTGIAVHYLMTGSPCVLGCLWKVTDKDIDVYLCKLIEHWANGKKLPMSLSAMKAQKYMRFPDLNGFACVIYGLPIHCQVTIAKFLDNLPNID